jgi:hypothetical protein
MQPHKVSFYVYADSAEAAAKLEQTLQDFVLRKRSQSIAVRAETLTQALEKFADNYFVNQFLKR